MFRLSPLMLPRIALCIFFLAHQGLGSRVSPTIQEIHPERYGDSRPHLFAYWTRDGYETTGCFNMDCPGFIQTGTATMRLGAAIDPVSHGGSLQKVALKLLKDKNNGDWWVYYGFNSVPTAVGYYPRSLFTYMAEKASDVYFGAYAIADRGLLSPPLGSGARPNGGQRSASFSNLQVIVDEGRTSKPVTEDLPTVAK